MDILRSAGTMGVRHGPDAADDAFQESSLPHYTPSKKKKIYIKSTSNITSLSLFEVCKVPWNSPEQAARLPPTVPHKAHTCACSQPEIPGFKHKIKLEPTPRPRQECVGTADGRNKSWVLPSRAGRTRTAQAVKVRAWASCLSPICLIPLLF